MNTAPSKETIEEVAQELDINPVFIEKDWYVVQLLQTLNTIDLLGAKLVFAGGTALAKAHHLLQRFSEDVDFRLIDPELNTLSRSVQRKRLSELKGLIQGAILRLFPKESVVFNARDENRYFSTAIEYESHFAPSEALRPHILIEFTASGLSLPSQLLPISSFIAQYTGLTPEIPSISCIDPVEAAVDKMSALVWRVPDRRYQPMDDDPDLARHIHDIAALHDRALSNEHFKQLTIETIARDNYRCQGISGLSITEKMAVLLEILEKNNEYIQEYDRFVKGMSYASCQIPTYEEAVEKLKKIAIHLLRP